MIKFILNILFYGAIAIGLLVGANEIARRLQDGSVRLDEEFQFTWNALQRLPTLFNGKEVFRRFGLGASEDPTPEQSAGATKCE